MGILYWNKSIRDIEGNNFNHLWIPQKNLQVEHSRQKSLGKVGLSFSETSALVTAGLNNFSL